MFASAPSVTPTSLLGRRTQLLPEATELGKAQNGPPLDCPGVKVALRVPVPVPVPALPVLVPRPKLMVRVRLGLGLPAHRPTANPEQLPRRHAEGRAMAPWLPRRRP